MKRGYWKLALLSATAMAFVLFLFGILFMVPGNPARKCQWKAGSACTCAGVRGPYVYACECCEASPCVPESDLKLDKILKKERERAREAYEAGKELRKQPHEEILREE